MVTALLVLCLFAAGVSAHDTTAISPTGWVDQGDVAIFPVGSSHTFGVSEEVPVGNIIARLTSENGHVQTKYANDWQNITEYQKSGFYRIFSFDTPDKGLYTFDLYHTEGSWTHVITNPPDTDGGLWINQWWSDINWQTIDKTSWASNWYIERCYPKHCYFKAFLAGPDADLSKANKPIFQTYEITPLSPIDKVGTGPFTFQVTYHYNPFSGINVTAAKVGTLENDPSILTGMTDSSGRVTLNLSTPGTWIVKSDTGTDPRVNSLLDLPRGPNSTEKSIVGNLHRASLVLRSDQVKPPEEE
jgi:hypothetical protein